MDDATDLSVGRLGLDEAARAGLPTELRRLAGAGDTSTSDGLMALLLRRS